MTDSPTPTGRRTRRARRVSLETYDALQRQNTAGRSRADGSDVLVADPDPGADLSPEDTQDGIPSQGSLRTDADQRNDLLPPTEAQFAGKDFLPAPGLRRVATALIARDRHIRHLSGLRLEFLWRRRGGQSRGAPVYGQTVLPSGLSRHAWNQMAQVRTGNAQERVHAVIWMAADHVVDLSPMQLEAMLYGLLLRIVPNPRDASELRLRAPNLKDYDLRQIERYGLFMQDLLTAKETFVQARITEPMVTDTWETTSVDVPETTTHNGSNAS